MQTKTPVGPGSATWNVLAHRGPIVFLLQEATQATWIITDWKNKSIGHWKIFPKIILAAKEPGRFLVLMLLPNKEENRKADWLSHSPTCKSGTCRLVFW